ncbi:uncharacterized protein LOC142533397 [Primulina tabacum]|uniref:uncharacterized protein LOC142533397 n=1 Tax=Primulina tabacum TaxID=48773 RepID=UPI003F597414
MPHCNVRLRKRKLGVHPLPHRNQSFQQSRRAQREIAMLLRRRKQVLAPLLLRRRRQAHPPPPQSEPPLHLLRLVRRRRPLILAQSIPHSGKRKIFEISVVSVSSPEGSGSDEGPPPESGVHPLYTSDTAIVGRGPTQLAQKIMYQLPSDTDAAFMNSLGWSDLTRQTCSSITEGMMYITELVERANTTRSTACQDLREGMALREQLQATIDEMKATHAKELSESQAQGDELLKEKQELLKEKHEL